jgi:hypothetical protein
MPQQFRRGPNSSAAATATTADLRRWLGGNVTAISDVAFAAFGARLAVLLSRGDESGIHSLAWVFVRANGDAGDPELAAELIGLARELVAAFNRSDPEGLEPILRELERDLFDDIIG